MTQNKLDKYQVQFLKYKEIEGLAKVSIGGYRRVFLNINDLIGEINYKNYEKVEEDVLKYFSKIAKINNNTTINNKRKYLYTFFNYLVTINVLHDNPIKTLNIKKRKESYEPRPTDSESIKKFLEVIDLKTYSGIRDYTFILLLSDTGIRPTEATRLKEEHIDIQNQFLLLPSDITKTKDSRVIPISKIVAENISTLLEINKNYWNLDYLFLTEGGLTTTTTLFQRRFVKYSKKSEVKITPYQLRHYFGTEYLNNSNGNILYLQKIMGHSDLKMTKKYVKIDKSMLKNNHKIATPLNAVIERNTRIRKLFK